MAIVKYEPKLPPSRLESTVRGNIVREASPKVAGSGGRVLKGLLLYDLLNGLVSSLTDEDIPHHVRDLYEKWKDHDHPTKDDVTEIAKDAAKKFSLDQINEAKVVRGAVTAMNEVQSAALSNTTAIMRASEQSEDLFCAAADLLKVSPSTLAHFMNAYADFLSKADPDMVLEILSRAAAGKFDYRNR